MTEQNTEISRDDVRAVAKLIAARIRRTPLIDVDVPRADGHTVPITLKLDCLQHSGSFKARGAFANLLTRPVPLAGVVAASGGNHGAAVAFAAEQLGVPANIFVPEVTSEAKQARVRSFSARLHVGGELYADALAASQSFVVETGALSIHAYDQRETLMGQATLAMELEDQRGDLDTVLVAVGGGGLIGGTAAWYGTRTRIVAVEPEAAPTLKRGA